MRGLDFTDATAVRQWLTALGSAVRDLETVTVDAIAPRASPPRAPRT
jgi:hypothetical protein